MKKIAPYTVRGDNRGKLIGIMNEGLWEEFNYLETFAGAVRGNHFHKQTLELFFIIEGEVDVVIKQTSEEIINEHLVTGDILLIEPGETHTFHCLKNTRWINFLSTRFNKDHPDLHFNN